MDTIKPVFKPKNVTLKDFIKQINPVKTIDRYNEMLLELFLIRHPQFKFDQQYHDAYQIFKDEHTKNEDLQNVGEWVFFPWNKILFHFLSEDDHFEVRTARNKNLITQEEQKKLYNSVVAIAGLSVGSHPALTITMMGMSKEIHIADGDEISASNLNRIRYDYTKIGEKKCDVVKEFIYQMNPYAIVHAYNEGVTSSNVDAFLNNVDVLIEEVDHLETKISLRIESRNRKIPVIMGTDNGDGVILDIERFDLNPSLRIFNGAIGDFTLDEFKKFPPQELPKLASKIAGPKIVAPKMLLSLLEVGKTLYSWPQLGDAATLCGVTLSYITKRIILNEPLREGKIEVNLDAILDPSYNEEGSTESRDKIRSNFAKVLGL
jgi:tRNA A37 threonylcarbamoyladenosine dehydratase